jgi:hypothetical protein
MLNRPVNTHGLTGILLTTAPYTLPPGIVEVGVSVLSENSVTPDYTITEYPASVTMGLPRNAELSLHGSYIHITEGAPASAPTDRQTGDLEMMYKWNFLPQPEASLWPAVSLIAGGGLPTGNNQDGKINSAQHWSMLLGIAAGLEIDWQDHALGIYLDGAVKGMDPAQKHLRDLYGTFNAGLLLPISKNQNLQMLLEYSMINGKDRITRDGSDYTGLTYGLRLVNERFNLTFGTQYLHKRTPGYERSGRVIGVMSSKF